VRRASKQTDEKRVMTEAPAAVGPTTMRVQLLGAFRITLGSQTIEESKWRRRAASALVKLLALEPSHRLHREQLLNSIWPDLPPSRAANNFHQALYLARRILDPNKAGKTRWLRIEDNFLILDLNENLWIDVHAFEEATRAARRSRDPSVYRRALDLYTGDLLPDDRYEEWALARRAALRQDHLSLLESLAGLYQAAHEHEKAFETYQQLLRIEPIHEDAHARLMELYAQTGRRDVALRQYEIMRETLRRELGVEPTAASQHIHRQILTGEIQPLPARPAIPLHNLPEDLTSFVGRTRDQKEIKQLLRTTRLLTLKGPGGCGKTRLALEVARGVLPTYADGVWLVELAALSDPSLVLPLMASVLGVIEEAGQPLLEKIKRALVSKKLLIVLDNCEHLIQACARLANEILAYDPHLTILATSREPLHIAGEVVWLVPSLTLPDLVPLPPFRDLVDNEAIRLFAERTASVLPMFTLTPADAPAVAQICTHLDGIPLAIELAAARMNALSVEQILVRLNDRFRLLTAGSRAVLNRQQTLRATMDWSHDLLSEKEQVLFRRLSVFSGGCTLEAVEGICAVAGPAANADFDSTVVLDLLSRLVDRSLVNVDRSSGEPRYHLLETIREYARQKLIEAGEAFILGERHRTWFTALVQRTNPQLWGQAHLEAMSRIEREHDNLRAAMAWLLEHDASSGLLLVASLWQFWILRGHLLEPTQILENLLRQSPKNIPMRADSLLIMQAFIIRSGTVFAARRLAEESLCIYRELENQHGMIRALQTLGALDIVACDYRQARTEFESSLTLARTTADVSAIACSTHFLGVSLSGLGHFALSRQLMEASVELFAQLGDETNITSLFVNLGAWAVYGVSKRWWNVDDETIILLRQAGAPTARGFALANLGALAQKQQDSAKAGEHFEAALMQMRTAGDMAGLGQVLNQLGNLASAERSYASAASYLEQSLTIRRQIGEERGIGRTLCSIANLAILTGDFERAHAVLHESEQLFTRMYDYPGLSAIRNHLGNLAFAEGDYARAEAFHQESVERYRQAASKRSAVALLNWAEIARSRGDFGSAHSRLSSSLNLFRAMGDPVGMAMVNDLLKELTKGAAAPTRKKIRPK
jgi:predicted ATPase/DNA-binding SARP family transcriptional activator